MPGRLDVIAAVPNFNMADSLRELLPSLLEQGYARVVVLDDASTDHTQDVIGEIGPDIEFVQGETNIGAAGNRNRLLSVLGKDVVIHFVDADMRLESSDTPEIAR